MASQKALHFAHFEIVDDDLTIDTSSGHERKMKVVSANRDFLLVAAKYSPE